MKTAMMLLMLVALVGCEEELTVAQICKEQPGMCSDLNEDSHCNIQRREVIFERYEEAKLPSDINKHKLLIGFEKYSKCIELAAGIEHIKLKEKTTSRVNGYLTSLEQIKRLTDETVSSDDPNLLYYHWSRQQSQSHLDKFLAAEQKGQLETPELQLALASYYMKRDLDKTINILHHALSLSAPTGKIDPEIYTILTTIYYKQRHFPLSFHWALLAENAGIERIEFALIRKELHQQQLDVDKIEQQAEQTISMLEQGKFVAPEL
jgi:hypothetical protein